MISRITLNLKKQAYFVPDDISTMPTSVSSFHCEDGRAHRGTSLRVAVDTTVETSRDDWLESSDEDEDDDGDTAGSVYFSSSTRAQSSRSGSAGLTGLTDSNQFRPKQRPSWSEGQTNADRTTFAPDNS